MPGMLALVVTLAVTLVVTLLVVAALAIRRATTSPASSSSNVSKLPSVVLPPNVADLPPLLPLSDDVNVSLGPMARTTACLDAYAPPPTGAVDVRTAVSHEIPVYTQQYEDCVENAVAYLIEYVSLRQHGRHGAFRPSRMWMSFDDALYRTPDQINLTPTALMQMKLGGPTQDAGGSFVEGLVGTLMLRGMVKEADYPYPTATQVKTQQVALHRARAALDRVRPLGQDPSTAAVAEWREGVERALAADGAYLRTWGFPPPGADCLANEHRVGHALVVGRNVTSIRKCLAHVGPVAFDMTLPWWFKVLGLNRLISHRATEAAVHDLLASEDARGINAEQRRFLQSFPSLSKILLTAYRDGLAPKQQSKVIARWFRAQRFPLAWGQFPHQSPHPFTAKQAKRFTSTLERHFHALDASSRRELARIPYPGREEDRQIRVLNEAGGLYDVLQRVVQLHVDYGLTIQRQSVERLCRRATRRHPAIRAAVDYFRQQTMGGHALVIVGYDDVRREFTVRNSWGEKWGDRGHCYLSYDYFDPTTDNPLRPQHAWIKGGVCVARVEKGNTNVHNRSR